MWYLSMQINIYLHVLFCFVEARINKLIFSGPFVCPLVLIVLLASGHSVVLNAFEHHHCIVELMLKLKYLFSQ